MNSIPNCFYRISVKALVLDEARDRFLITKEENQRWELPGGGIDWDTDPREELEREIMEEMGLKTTWIAHHPAYFFTDLSQLPDKPKANVLYETKLESLDFTPSDECIEIKFVNVAEAQELDLFENVQTFIKLFDPKRHTQ